MSEEIDLDLVAVYTMDPESKNSVFVYPQNQAAALKEGVDLYDLKSSIEYWLLDLGFTLDDIRFSDAYSKTTARLSLRITFAEDAVVMAKLHGILN